METTTTAVDDVHQPVHERSPVLMSLDEAMVDVRAEIAVILDRRSALIDHAADRLRGSGFDALVVAVWKGAEAGTDGTIIETWETPPSGKTWHRAYFSAVDGPRSTIFLVPWETHPCLVVRRGTFRIVFVDGDRAIIVRVPGADDEAAAHRSALARLRTAAARESLRVSVRDRVISVVDPMNTVVHQGDVLSAFAYVAGIDLSSAKDWPALEELSRKVA